MGLVECGGKGGVRRRREGSGAGDFTAPAGERRVGGGVRRAGAAGEMAGGAFDCVGNCVWANRDVRDAVWSGAAGACDKAARKCVVDGESDLRAHDFLWGTGRSGGAGRQGLTKFSEGNHESRIRDLRWNLFDCA